MPIIQYTAQLDFTDNGTFETGWRIKQGDFGDCEIIFRVVNNGVDMYDAEITPEIVFRRADGASIISTMTPNDGTYKYTFVGNELAVPGPTLVDVKYTDSEGRISTASCRFTVVEDTIGYDPSGASTYNNPVSVLIREAVGAAEESIDSAKRAEGYAVGTQGGQPVGRTSEYYHNNSKFYRDEASALADAFTSKAVETETGSFKSLTGGKLESCVVNFVPVQSGSGDPSPSNVRPITGHSSIDVDFYGKNFYDGSDVEKTASDLYVEVTLTHPIPGGSIYYLSAIAENELLTISQLLIRGYDSNGVKQVETSLPNGRGGRTSCPFWPFGSNDIVKLRFYGSNYSTTSTNEVTFKDICIEKSGYEDYVYEPFVSKSENYGLGGTYYSGQVNLATGEMTVDEKIVVFDGSNDENIGYLTNPLRFNIEMPSDSILSGTGSDVQTKHFGLSSNEFAEITDEEGRNGSIGFHLRVNNTHNMLLCLGASSTITDVASLRTWLSSNNLQVCYPLATPQTIQLTPQQIDTLVGMNNIVIPDAGQSLDSVIYRGVFAWDDVTDVVDAVDAKNADVSAIGTDESGRTTASRYYVYSERFYKDGKFCRVTSTSGVAQGATWTLGTNYEESYIATDLRNAIAQVLPATGITFGINKVTRKGYTVQVLLRLTTPSSTSGTTTLGSVPYLPANADFAFLQYMHQNAPYTPLGNVFIRQLSGEVVLPQDAPTNTGIFVFGTYICQ